MKTDILLNGPMVKNHISLETGFGYNVTRRTSFLSWFQACQRVRPPVLIIQLQRHLQDKRGLVLHLLQARLLYQRHHQVIMKLEKKRIELKVIPNQRLCQVPMFMTERGNPLWTMTTKNFQKQKKRNPRRNRASRCLPTQVVQALKSRGGCKNSEKILWMTEFLNAETHTQVLLMEYL